MTTGADTDRPFRVALWGARSVGKTSALAAYVCHTKPAWIDTADHETTGATVKTLLEKWNPFANKQLPFATIEISAYRLRHKSSGRMIELWDVRGGGTEALDQGELNVLNGCDAVIHFVSWPSGEVRPLVALNNAIAAAGHKPAALVLTKVESHLRLEEVGLFLYNPIDMAKKHRFPQELVRAMSTKCRGHVYPISVFGYGSDLLPAYVIDEFARPLPWGVAPLNVHLPFDDVLGAIS